LRLLLRRGNVRVKILIGPRPRERCFEGRGRAVELRSIPHPSQTARRMGHPGLMGGWSLWLGKSGGQRRDRTADAGLFRAALYH